MKHLAIAILAIGLPVFAQIVTPAPEPPKFFLSLGAGFSELDTPHYLGTGTFGVHIGDGLYSTTSLDSSSKFDNDTKTRKTQSTIRTGAQKLIVKQGPISLFGHGDLGAAVGGGNVVGSFSTGGTATYNLPRIKNSFVYATIRILKSPQQDPNADPATVKTAFSFGFGRVF